MGEAVNLGLVAVGVVILAAVTPLRIEAHTLLLTGEVRSREAREIVVPASNISPVTIRYFLPDGRIANPGDVVLRIDPGVTDSQMAKLEAQREQMRASSERDQAELQVKAIDASLALVDAKETLSIARIDARVPRGLIPALNYDRFQGELKRALREVELGEANLRRARAAVERSRIDSELALAQLSLEIEYNKRVIESSKVVADRLGTVVHGFNQIGKPGRIDEGSAVLPGSSAGQIVVAGGYFMRAYALESDRRFLRDGQAAEIALDVAPGRPIRGRVAAISRTPERKTEWGNGRYFIVDIDIQEEDARLMPGMSGRVVLRTDSAKGH